MRDIGSAQTTLGIGLLSVSFNEKTVIPFYSKLNDKFPVKTIEFFNDQTINSWNIKNLESQKEWLNPEVLWLDYSPLVFRVKSKSDQGFQVIVNDKTGQTYWVKRNKSMTFLTWETFLKNMFSVARLNASAQKIRKLPYENAGQINYNGKDCFQIKSIKGDWIEIFTADHCDENKSKIKTGWLKWRQGNKLLIEYFITS
jgi:hypothetical protein